MNESEKIRDLTHHLRRVVADNADLRAQVVKLQEDVLCARAEAHWFCQELSRLYVLDKKPTKGDSENLIFMGGGK
ncbi:MAG: hypothetical protein ACE5EK_11275 [Nitrospinales bacterium]